MIDLTRLNHTAFALVVYASQLSSPAGIVRPRKTDFRLVANLYRAGLVTRRTTL